MRPVTLLLAGFLVLTVGACSGGASPSASSAGVPTPRPTPSTIPTPGPARTLAELKYALIDGFGPLWYCDPDFYPIQREDELAAALERWPDVVADLVAFEAITARLGLDPEAHLDEDERLAVYRAWKVLNAIALDPIGNDTFRFDYLAQPKAGAAEGSRTSGTISLDGDVNVERQAAAGEPMCPICLSRGTRIETPDGPLPVEGLRIGDPVWTLDSNGRRVRGVVIAIGSTGAPAGHHVMRLVLADGRTVTASPGHPLADGRRLDDLRSGDLVDGAVVLSADLVSYDGARTYDLAVSGPTGIYLVEGIPMGSTLRP